MFVNCGPIKKSFGKIILFPTKKFHENTFCCLFQKIYLFSPHTKPTKREKKSIQKKSEKED